VPAGPHTFALSHEPTGITPSQTQIDARKESPGADRDMADVGLPASSVLDRSRQKAAGHAVWLAIDG
jgi:hypothetical protein